MQIVAPNPTEQAHLEAVIAEMRELGAPTVRAIWVGVHGLWLAVEGSHRLAAAAELGLTPTIDPVAAETEENLDVRVDSLDPQYQDNHTIGEYIEMLPYMHNSPIYTFDE